MSNDYLIILTLKKFVNSLPYYDFTGKVDNPSFSHFFCEI